MTKKLRDWIKSLKTITPPEIIENKRVFYIGPDQDPYDMHEIQDIQYKFFNRVD